MIPVRKNRFSPRRSASSSHKGVGAPKEGDVFDRLEIGDPNGPGIAVGATPVVPSGEPVQAHHPGPLAGQVVEGGTAGAAGSQHNGVEMAHIGEQYRGESGLAIPWAFVYIR